MNRIGFALLAALLLAAGTPALAQTPTTFVLTNEGGLIDDLIAGGYGESNLYETLVALAPASNGAIPEAFLDTLAACPAGSEIFTAQLHNFSENWPVCVNSDGTISIQPIYARDVFQKEGYSTYPNPYLPGTGRELFTRATAPEHYLRAGVKEVVGGNVTYYWAFAIAWSLEKAPTTVVLTNEGGLIDDLIARGYGESNLYQTLVALAPSSGGAIPEAFLDTLAACPAGSEIFTAQLHNYSVSSNWPVCINSDGTVRTQPIFARDYFQKNGYQTYPNPYQPGTGRELFTSATAPEYYINAGSTTVGGVTKNYHVFAIAWSLDKIPTTVVLSNESPGYLIDGLIAAGHGSKNLYQVLQLLQPDSGGAIPQQFLDTLAACPAGSEVFTVALSNFSGLNNPVCVNSDGSLMITGVYGRDLSGRTGYTDHSGSPIGSCSPVFTAAETPAYYIDTGNSPIGEVYHYHVFAVAWATAVPASHTVSFVAGSGGTITGTTSQMVADGGSASAVTAVPSVGFHFVNWTGTGFATSTANPLTVTGVTSDLTITANFAATSPASIGLNHSRLNFGKAESAVTSAQTLLVRNTGGGTLAWTAAPSAGWIVLDKTSGSGAGRVQVAVNPAGLGNGTYNGTITITDPAAGNSPQTVTVSLTVKARGANPSGLFETPADGAAGVTGSVAVTGWAVDDVEVTAVQIYRSPLAGEGTAPIYIGDACLVEGARPDVEATYSAAPWNYRLGWGYMLLTNFLPAGGNGTFILIATAVDRDGHRVQIGSKRITCDNAHATLPFGAIDTPSQGGAATGSSYVNFGWVLTPLPATIPVDGSTLWVWVDGAPLGHPTYDQYREDIATLFPGYANSDGAVGYYYLDPFSLSEGVHTIAWSARDDLGREDGIGSRYFSVSHDESAYQLGTPQNEKDSSVVKPPTQWAVSHDESFHLIGTDRVGAGLKPAPTSGDDTGNGLRPLPPPSAPPSWEGGWGERNVSSSGASAHLEPGTWNMEPETWNGSFLDTPLTPTPLRVRRGFAGNEETIYPDREGVVVVTARPGEPLAICLDPDYAGANGIRPIYDPALPRTGAMNRFAGYERVGADLRRLPVGSCLDAETGLFTWLPGPGFRGSFALEFVTGQGPGGAARQRVIVRVE